MILESVLSCSYLLLVSGSSIYSLVRHSYDEYQKLLPHFVFACGGVAMISSRSVIVLMYKLFFKQYSLDPETIQIEEKQNGERFNGPDELLGTLSIASILYSLFCHHKYCILGAFIVSALCGLDVINFYNYSSIESQEIDTSQIRNILARRTSRKPKSTNFVWVFISCHFAYSVGNYYAFLANYPYLLTTWSLTPEGFYQGWTLRRTINDYMMAAYAIYMTEALRQT
ncbi:uncharacterized protein LOC122397422 [Colletes gigas]|uniref:uncharacterized protein LOC122397422 n=1 Tax=Colletes gigas TaxID=935657 RepID=UPI001C9A6BB6|nr:uncharacterized protein LOC122397422 [Colletes gigas]